MLVHARRDQSTGVRGLGGGQWSLGSKPLRVAAKSPNSRTRLFSNLAPLPPRLYSRAQAQVFPRGKKKPNLAPLPPRLCGGRGAGGEGAWTGQNSIHRRPRFPTAAGHLDGDSAG